MKSLRQKSAFLLLPVLLLGALLRPGSALAQSETGYDILSEVNALRTAQGLEPYTTDSWLMDYAQQHTQYQADNLNSTHRHSDGSYAWDIGLKENIAVGTAGYMNPHTAVYQIWQDWGHLEPMIGYASGAAGAGVALGADGNVYYTLNVRSGAPVSQNTPLPGQTAQPALATAPFIPLITNTPNPEGVIIHIVAPGESLWGIAISYGVTMDNIRGLNGMAAADITIYEGQRLVIRTGVQPPLAPTSMGAQPTSLTQPPLPSETPTPTRAPTRTPVPSPTPTAAPIAALPALWQANQSGALLTAAVGALLGAGLTLLVIQLARRRGSRTLSGQALTRETPPENEPTAGEPR
ncbi:MAG: LysM peptidoglycan-binding domain-containing protein [Anaerolineaceae bacterium]